MCMQECKQRQDLLIVKHAIWVCKPHLGMQRNISRRRGGLTCRWARRPGVRTHAGCDSCPQSPPPPSSPLLSQHTRNIVLLTEPSAHFTTVSSCRKSAEWILQKPLSQHTGNTVLLTDPSFCFTTVSSCRKSAEWILQKPLSQHPGNTVVQTEPSFCFTTVPHTLYASKHCGWLTLTST